ncbi:hypothetical protein AB0C76_32075 [Kitasatospora sp. NPDC048722]|uniref:RipA family octameric membrane protein n=1 Tax=Kitasatospora sp. NPDC048722 TaxID=3155639 RepID=UPI0033C9DB7D
MYDLAIERTRDLHADVWNGVRFFTGLQVVILTAVGALAGSRSGGSTHTATQLALLSIATGFSLLGLYALRGHRRYYLEALRVKTVLEEELQLYSHQHKRVHHSLALPWSVTDNRNQLLEDPEAWKSRMVFRFGTITAALFIAYVGFIILDMAVLAITATGTV